MKLKRKIDLDGKVIEIYDDVFTAEKRFSLYHFAVNSLYTVDRQSYSVPERTSFHKTLKSEFSLKDILVFKFFEDEQIINYIKKNKLRISRCYVNLCSASDTYQYHVDHFTAKCPSALYYLNLEWDPTWEGETHFSDDSMQDILYSSAFIPGRLVIFDGTIPHKSSQPAPNAKYYRFVFAIKFETEKSPKWKEAIAIEDFIYKKDHELTEKEKACLSFIKDKTYNIPHSNTTFYEHLENTFYVLKSLGQPQNVCLAGMFHAVFGTESFNFKAPISKEEVTKVIGEEATYLVEQFSLPNRDTVILQNLNDYDLKTQLALVYILYANLIEQASRIPLDEKLFTVSKDKIETLEEMLKRPSRNDF